jgi:hypothetical protein
MAEGHSQRPRGGGHNVGNLRLRVHTWLQDTVLGVSMPVMFRREAGTHAGVFGLPFFESGFVRDSLFLAAEFRCALRIWPDRDGAVCKIGSRPTYRISTADAALLNSGGECSGIPLNELAYAHRRLACQLLHIVGEAIVAAVLMKDRHRCKVGDEVGWNAHAC